MKVTVLSVHDMNAPGAKGVSPYRAKVGIKVGPLEIYQCRLIKEPGKKAYVSPPQIESVGAHGTIYIPLAKWPQEWRQPILDAVWAAYEEGRGGPVED